MIHSLDIGQEVLLTPGGEPVTDAETRYAFFAGLENHLNTFYKTQRQSEYPPITDYLDAVVKGDQAQIDAYIAACQAVKAKYPKPESV